jgi:hypothetical protein
MRLRRCLKTFIDAHTAASTSRSHDTVFRLSEIARFAEQAPGAAFAFDSPNVISDDCMKWWSCCKPYLQSVRQQSPNRPPKRPARYHLGDDALPTELSTIFDR